MDAEDQAGHFVRYFTEVLGEGNVDLIDDLFAEDCLIQGPHITQPIQGTATLKQVVAGFRSRNPGMTITIDDVLAGEDHAVVRWTHHSTYGGGPLGDYPPCRPGSYTVSVVGILHIRDGKITRYWDQPDLLNRWRQLGIRS